MTHERFCPHCGQVNGATAKFCGHCGQPLPPVDAPAAPVKRRGWLIGGVVLLAVIGAAMIVGRGLWERPNSEVAAVPPTAIVTILPSLAPPGETPVPRQTPTATPTTQPTKTSIPTTTPLPTPSPTAVPETPQTLIAQAVGEGQVFLGDSLILDMVAEEIGCFGVGAIDYSPTGDYFVVVFDCFEGDNEAFLFQADGSGKRRITGEWDYVNYHQYEWSLDGRTFIYQRINSCCADPPSDAPPPGTVRYDVATGAESSPTPLVSSNVTAVQITAPPTIDGSLAEWPVTATYLSTHQVFTVRGWDGSDDLTAVWQLTWDANNLYIGATVTDDTHVQTQTGLDIYRGDSLEMQIDTDRAGDLSVTNLSPDDFQLVFSPGNFGNLPPSAVRVRGSASGRIQDAPGHHIVVAAQRTATGYTLETAVPWSDLNVTPYAGLVLGLALNVNDNDTPGTAVQEIMKSTAPARTLTNPSTWGTLELQPAPAASAPPNQAIPQEISIQATQSRNESDLFVSQGQTIIIEYSSGNWRAGPLPDWPLVGPDGDEQVSAKPSFPVSDAPIMSLVGGIGEERSFLVGQRLEFQAATSGQLWLGANDDNFADNAGALTVHITITK